MRLEVPFYRQTTPLNCGPTALKMVLAYFGKDFSIETLEERTGTKEGKAICTIQIATAAAALGYKVDFYSKHILFNEEHMKHEYYQQYGDMDLEQSKKWIEEARAAGVNVQERTLSLDELLKLITETSLPIVLLDWSVVTGSRGYQGHFVPVVGFDENNVFIHNHGLKGTKDFMAIPKEVFDSARKAEGTDEDVVIVYRSKAAP